MTVRVPLQCHPESTCKPLTGIEVEVSRRGARRIDLCFALSGDVRAIEVPPPDTVPDGRLATPRRVDGLWRHTCFEAFVRAGDEESYYEFNLSPSRNWACYAFSGYRAGMTDERHVGPPGIRAARPLFHLGATLEMEQMAALSIHEPWHLGLSAVIEERNGNKSYWALKHPPGAPDFHHPDCFALELPAARPV